MEDGDKIVSYLEFRYKKDDKILGEELLMEAENLLNQRQNLEVKILGFRNILEKGKFFDIDLYDEYFGIKSIAKGQIGEEI